MTLSLRMPTWIDDHGPCQFLPTYIMVPCSPGEKECLGHPELSEFSFYHKEGKLRIDIKFNWRTMYLNFLPLILWSTICTCYRSLSDGSSDPATILPLGASLAYLNEITVRTKHDPGVEGWYTEGIINSELQSLGSKAGFLPSELYCKEWTESAKWVNCWVPKLRDKVKLN